MLNISLKTFALTGEFGPVKIGMHRDEIVRLLGEPEADSDFGAGSSGLLYSWYEFFYLTDSGQLFAIQNDHLYGASDWHADCILFENEKWKLDAWFLEVGKNFTMEEMRNILKEEGIPFEEQAHYESFMFLLPSGVYFDFFDPDDDFFLFKEKAEGKRDELHYLNGIRFFPRY